MATRRLLRMISCSQSCNSASSANPFTPRALQISPGRRCTGGQLSPKIPGWSIFVITSICTTSHGWKRSRATTGPSSSRRKSSSSLTDSITALLRRRPRMLSLAKFKSIRVNSIPSYRSYRSTRWGVHASLPATSSKTCSRAHVAPWRKPMMKQEWLKMMLCCSQSHPTVRKFLCSCR